MTPTVIETRQTVSVTDSVSFTLEIPISGPSVSDIFRVHADSVQARHHFEDFLRDLKRMHKRCDSTGLHHTSGPVINARDYDEWSYRPEFKVLIDGEIEASAFIIDDTPGGGGHVTCRIRIDSSPEARKFAREIVHSAAINYTGLGDWYIVIEVDIRMANGQQTVDGHAQILKR